MFLEALEGKNKSRPPVWLMRQAGRYLPEYRKVREKHSLLEMFHTPDIITKVTLQPIDILGVDAAILFSDILTVLDGLGIPYDFQPGPKVDFQGFHKPVEDPYRHIKEAIAQLKSELKVPLIGFAGGPFTVLSYILEGGSSRDFKKTKQLMIQDPEQFDLLFNTVLEETIAYLKIQDVDAIQIFDSWANVLSPFYFAKYVQAPLERIVEAMKVPVILFCRGAADKLAVCNPAGISVDWTFDLPALRKQLPKEIALQGNLDPMMLYGSKQTVKQHVEALLKSMAGDPAYIFNLGHGMLPDLPVENVHTLVETVKASPALHELSHSA